MEIKPITSADTVDLHRLWTETLGSRWPISEATLTNALGITEDDANHFRLGLWQDQVLQGTVVATLTRSSSAAITFLAVHPAHQRQGVATRLIHEVIKLLKVVGVKSVSLGAGSHKLLWHGVPTSLPAACRFFQHAGFVYHETSYDLIQNISDFQVPPDAFRCRDTYAVSFEMITHHATPNLLAFEQKHFPNWHRYFEQALANGRYSDVLLAKRKEEIIGTVLLSEVPECPGGHWREFLGPKLGALGILGVEPSHREHGVGLALAAYATQMLRERGVTNCFLHWTWLRDWYGRLGYTVWEEYKMGKLQIEK